MIRRDNTLESKSVTFQLNQVQIPSQRPITAIPLYWRMHQQKHMNASGITKSTLKFFYPFTHEPILIIIQAADPPSDVHYIKPN